MIPAAPTPADRRELLHAALAASILRPLPPDPDLVFRVDLRRRPTPRRPK